MFKILSNISLKNIILTTILFFSITIFAFTIIYLGIKVRSNSKIDSQAIVDQYTRSNALKIEGILNETMCVTRTLSCVLSGNLDSNLNDFNQVNKQILGNTLKKNPNFLQVWFDWEIKLIKPDYPNNYGRVGSVVSMNKDGSLEFERHLKDTVDTEPNNDYTTTKKTGNEMVGEPYYDAMSQKYSGLLMVSPTVPMIADNKFLGWVGIDLDMSRIQGMVKDIKPFSQSTAYLISPGKTIVAQNEEKFNNKNILEINEQYKSNFSEALMHTDKGENYSFIYNNSNNEEVYVSLVPLLIGRNNEVWVLATETPLKEIFAKSQKAFINTILLGMVGIVLLCLLVYFILNKTLAKLKFAVEHSKKIAEGDLSIRMDVEGKNEISILGLSLNQMVERIKAILTEINNISGIIDQTSKAVNNFSLEIAESSSNQAASVEEVMASMEEMTSNIQNNSNNARQTETIAEKALQGITTGSNSAKKTVESINKIVENIAFINEISRQTNILALNAAVEAARAGSYGKGFAVVANEVKKLAENAQNSAKQISALSIDSMKISDYAEKVLSELLPDIDKTATLISEIANASQEQSNGANQIQNVIMQLNNIAQKNANLSEQLKYKANELTVQASQLKHMIGYFKMK